MNRRKFLKTAMISGIALTALRFTKMTPVSAQKINLKGRPTPSDRIAAAQQLFANRPAGLNAIPAMNAGGTPDYFGATANCANSPLPPLVAITGGGGIGAQAVASVVGGVIQSILVTNPGSGYTTVPTVTISAYDGTLATATAAVAVAGTITSLVLTAGGTSYTSAPTVSFQDVVGGGGNTASATATITNNVVTGLTLTGGGAGYTANASVVFSGGGGNGAAAQAVINGLTGITVGSGGSGYMGMRKFVDALSVPGTAASNILGQYLPIATADQSTFSGSDYYEMGEVEYSEQMHSDLAPTRLRGYVQLETSVIKGKGIALTYPNGSPILDLNGAQVYAVDNPHYMGPIIISNKDVPVRIKFTNYLPTGPAGKLFLPVDPTVMGAGMGPDMMHAYTDNRTTIHLHGGVTPWISDGTPHQWFTPANEAAFYARGEGYQNVPDMFFDRVTHALVPAGTAGATNDPGPGSLTLYYTNQQSARLMFYHDHAYGITRLNVYAGFAAGYIVRDPVEQGLIGSVIPSNEIPLVIQDKTFVPGPNQMAVEDPTWNHGTTPPIPHAGDLWFPHVYMPNQNPGTLQGANPCGRWDYALWFWPPYTGLLNHDQVPNPLYSAATAAWENPYNPGFPNDSMTMEGFMDTPIVNGTAYPYLVVDPTAYRFRILNACDDRSLNLQIYQAKSSLPMWNLDGPAGAPGTLANPDAGEVNMVPAAPDTGLPATWPVDGRDGGVPDPLAIGPSWYQIGTEGGFLPGVAVIPPTPVGYDYNRRSITVLNVLNKCLFMGPAERADVILDFAPFAGKTLIMYNDAPAANPAFDPRMDYYTGDPDQSETGQIVGGAPTTQPGYGPNTRTVMQIQVRGVAAAGTTLSSIVVGAAGVGYTQPTVTIGSGTATAVATGSVDAVIVSPSGTQYTTPSVSFTGTGTGAAALATGPVDSLVIKTGGTGYVAPLSVSITDGAVTAGAGASATVSGAIDAVLVTTPGSGYTAPTVLINDPTGSGATATASIDGTGAITGITVTVAGSGYTAPTVAISDPGTPTTLASATATMTITVITLGAGGAGYAVPTVAINGATGTGATAAATISVTGAFVTAGGSGYNPAPSVTIAETVVGGLGAGATATATLKITAINLTNAGSGYTVPPSVTVGETAPGLGMGASATALLTGAASFNLGALQTALPTAYGSIQPLPIIPNAVYNTAFGQTYPVDSYVRIQDTTHSMNNGQLAKLLLTNAGLDYTSAPIVGFTGGGGSGAAATAAITGATVTSITLSANGSGYTSAPTVSFTGGGPYVTSTATASAQITGIVWTVTVTNGGRNYATAPKVSFTGGGGTGATATATISTTTHTVTSITIVTNGTGYTSAPSVSFNNSGTGGNGAAATATITRIVNNILITNPGAGYSLAPGVSITGGGGSGATALATYLPGYVLTPLTLTNAGANYTSAPLVTFTGGGAPTTTATATVGLMNLTIDLLPKAIQELFEIDYGRMNATLGVEVPFTNNNNQTTIPYGYIDPPTEIFGPSKFATPVGSTGDGTQIWKITHNGVDTHAVHIHLLNWQVINRVGWDGQVKPPAANEIGWKETILMNPLEDCIVAVRSVLPELPFQLPNSIRNMDVTMPPGNQGTMFFNVDPTGQPATVINAPVNFGWEYVWHCHLLSHEEMDFMRPMIFAVPPLRPTGLTAVMSGRNVKLTWTNNAVNDTGFTVQRSLSQTGPWANLGQVAGTIVNGATVTYTDTAAARRTNYLYRVIANNMLGYTQTYAAPAVGYPTYSADSLPSDGVSINTGTGATGVFIFSSNFMNGLTAWTAVVGNVVVLQTAAMGPGATAGAATIIGPTLAPAGLASLDALGAPLASYLIDASPDNIDMYDASFYFNPNQPRLGEESDVTIFTGLDQSGQPLFGVQYAGNDPTSGELSAWVMRDGERRETGSVTIDSSPHLIEVAWRSGDNPGFTLYLEGQAVGNSLGDTNVYLDMVLLGPSSGVAAGSSANMYFAEFTSSQIDGTPHFTFLPGIFH